jgi:hypothetical protein
MHLQVTEASNWIPDKALLDLLAEWKKKMPSLYQILRVKPLQSGAIRWVQKTRSPLMSFIISLRFLDLCQECEAWNTTGINSVLQTVNSGLIEWIRCSVGGRRMSARKQKKDLHATKSNIEVGASYKKSDMDVFTTVKHGYLSHLYCRFHSELPFTFSSSILSNCWGKFYG